jgi:hypothetical protein
MSERWRDGARFDYEEMDTRLRGGQDRGEGS